MFVCFWRAQGSTVAVTAGLMNDIFCLHKTDTELSDFIEKENLG